jgi:hypothetical protein
LICCREEFAMGSLSLAGHKKVQSTRIVFKQFEGKGGLEVLIRNNDENLTNGICHWTVFSFKRLQQDWTFFTFPN